MIHIEIDFRSPLPLYEQVKEQLRFAVLSGSLQPGEQLPSIRHLAVELNINPNTVARVYRELEQEGFLESRQGKGSFVSHQREPVSRERGREMLREEILVLLRKARALGMTREELLAAIEEEESGHE